MIDYVHLFNYGDCFLSSTNGRQLNFIDYLHYFSDKYPDKIQPYYLVGDLLNTKRHGKILKDFVFDPSIRNLRTLQPLSIPFIDISFFSDNRDVLLCDFTTLYVLINNKIELNYNKIFVFDCLELTVFLRNLTPPPGLVGHYSQINRGYIINYLQHNKDKITYLATDYNFNDLDLYGFSYIKYYKKINFNIFNKDYIDSLEIKNDLVYYYAKANEESPDFGEFINKIKSMYGDITFTNNFMDIWEYNTILYTQKPYVGNIEQFGRMVFELKYFGYDVVIDSMFKTEKTTGLDCYLTYYENNDIVLHHEDFLDILYER